MGIPRREVPRFSADRWRKDRPVSEEYWQRLNIEKEIKKLNGLASRLETAVNPNEVELGWKNYRKERYNLVQEVRRLHVLFPEGSRNLRKIDELVWRDAFIDIPQDKWNMAARPAIMRITAIEKELSATKSSIVFNEGYKELVDTECALYGFLRGMESAWLKKG